jgi:hypothetical protein
VTYGIGIEKDRAVDCRGTEECRRRNRGWLDQDGLAGKPLRFARRLLGDDDHGSVALFKRRIDERPDPTHTILLPVWEDPPENGLEVASAQARNGKRGDPESDLG